MLTAHLRVMSGFVITDLDHIPLHHTRLRNLSRMLRHITARDVLHTFETLLIGLAGGLIVLMIRKPLARGLAVDDGAGKQQQ